MTASADLLCFDGISRSFGGRRRFGLFPTPRVRAVGGVSLRVLAGETLGVVGESGCGKSTLGRLALGILAPEAGTVRFRGVDLATLSPEARRDVTRDIQIIFQDPLAALDPRLRVRAQIREGLDIHAVGDPAAREEAVDEVLAAVGLASDIADRFPHELSGGQQQRVVIARVLVLRPRLIVCDEPVSALDVSVQAQVVNLLRGLQRDHGIAYLFISHDLRIVRHVSHRVAVMYLGTIVEEGPRDLIFDAPLHPYTQGLLAAIPIPSPGRMERHRVIVGEPPDPAAPPTGCAFHPRCPHASAICRDRPPAARTVSAGRRVACHLIGESAHDR